MLENSIDPKSDIENIISLFFQKKQTA